MGKRVTLKKINKLSLKGSFIHGMFWTIVAVVILSGITIWGCISIRNMILPNPDNYILSYANENYDFIYTYEMTPDYEYDGADLSVTDAEGGKGYYKVKKISNGYDKLSVGEKAMYVACNVMMIVLPTIYSVVGIIICAIWFYKNRLNTPISVLEVAAEKIAKRDLDFKVEYKRDDELGKLCNTFEVMRQELYDSNTELWNIVEERKKLYASVAHDLRNPIAIIEGYAEYMYLNIQNGKLDKEKLLSIINNISSSAKRLEYYTNSIRDIDRLEQLDITMEECELSQVLNSISEDFQLIGRNHDVEVIVENHVTVNKVLMDKQVFCRVLENLFSNALRFAKKKITLVFRYENNSLYAYMLDDGPGFATDVLENKNIYFKDKKSEHIGMGLVISRILCKKHGGSLEISNDKTGAVAEIKIKVDKIQTK